jgi:hypothetical protein
VHRGELEAAGIPGQPISLEFRLHKLMFMRAVVSVGRCRLNALGLSD